MRPHLSRCLFSALLICCLAIPGCPGGDKLDGKVYHQDNGPFTVEFKNGKAKVEMMGESKTFDYKVEGDKVTIINKAEGDLVLTRHSDGTLSGPVGTLRMTK